MSFTAFDIIHFLEDNRIDYATEGDNISEGWIGVQCPFCSDHANHLGINLNSKTINCWMCPAKGSIKKYVRKVLDTNWWQANRIIEQYQNRELIGEYGHYVRSHSDTVRLPEGVLPTLLPMHNNYLLSRRFDPDYLVRKYGVLGGHLSGPFKYRLVIPVFFEGEIVSFVGRDVTGQAGLAYKNLPYEHSVLSPKETFYNLDSVKDKAIVVEGIFDAWRIGDGAIATFGTKVTSEQISLLSGLKEVYVLFDSKEKDPNAPEQAEELAYRIASVVDKVEVLELASGDPADLNEQEVAALRWEYLRS